MKLRVFSNMFFLFFASQSCISQGNDKSAQAWLNVKYIECLKSKLPCDCEKITKGYYSMVVELNPESKKFAVVLSTSEQMEPNRYPIKKMASNVYAVTKSDGDTSIWAEIILKEEKLQFIERSTVSEFSKSKNIPGNSRPYLLDNVDLLDQAFVARGYPKLEDIVKEDALSCACNKWMGGRNVLYVKGVPKSWIIEMKGDSVHILKITNMERDPDDPVQTEQVASYKWK